MNYSSLMSRADDNFEKVTPEPLNGQFKGTFKLLIKQPDFIKFACLQDNNKTDYTDREEGKTNKSAALIPFLAFDPCLALIIKKFLRNIFNKFIR